MTEPTTERRSARFTAWASAGAIALVALTPMLLSAQSLAAWGRDSLGLSGLLPWLVPASLDVAALATIALALHATLRGESGAAPKAVAWVLVAGSAVANHQHGRAIGTRDAEVYYPALPILAMVLIELGLRYARRPALIAAGRAEAALPRWRAARWLRYPGETFAAWSIAVSDGITSPVEAVREVRRRRDEVPGVTEAPGELAADAIELRSMTKVEALRAAFDALGEVDAPKAMSWLGRRGVQVSANHSHQVARKVRTERPQHAAVPVSGNGAS